MLFRFLIACLTILSMAQFNRSDMYDGRSTWHWKHLNKAPLNSFFNEYFIPYFLMLNTDSRNLLFALHDISLDILDIKVPSSGIHEFNKEEYKRVVTLPFLMFDEAISTVSNIDTKKRCHTLRYNLIARYFSYMSTQCYDFNSMLMQIPIRSKLAILQYVKELIKANNKEYFTSQFIDNELTRVQLYLNQKEQDRIKMSRINSDGGVH